MHAQTPPFGEDELYRAFRLVAPEEDARAMAKDALAADVSPFTVPPAAQPRADSAGLAFTPIPRVSLTEDTLILLSLLSDDLRERVDRYRAERRGGAVPGGEEQRAWEARRAQLAPLVQRGGSP